MKLCAYFFQNHLLFRVCFHLNFFAPNESYDVRAQLNVLTHFTLYVLNNVLTISYVYKSFPRFSIVFLVQFLPLRRLFFRINSNRLSATHMTAQVRRQMRVCRFKVFIKHNILVIIYFLYVCVGVCVFVSLCEKWLFFIDINQTHTQILYR